MRGIPHTLVLCALAALLLAPPAWARELSRSVEVVARIEPELSLTIEDDPHVVFGSDDAEQEQSLDRSVSYQLRVPPGQSAGTYRGTVVMTVTAR